MLKKILITLGTLLSTTSSFADAPSAVHNLFANFAHIHVDPGMTEPTTIASPTLVKHIYSLYNKQNQFLGYTNEAGTLLGDTQGFKILSEIGAQPQPLSVEETNDLRAEVTANIDYDKLPKVTYGNGGGRHIIMFSAVDCSFCRRFEDTISKSPTGINTTFHVVPLSLRTLEEGGLAQWQTISNILCADNPGAAWQVFWAFHSIPQPQQCQFSDPRSVEKIEKNLHEILMAVGIHHEGTPRFLR